MKRILFLLFILISNTFVFAQINENSVWLFGENNLLDFRQPDLINEEYPIIRYSDTTIMTNNYVYSDLDGNFLLYTNADTIFTLSDTIPFNEEYSENRPFCLNTEGSDILDLNILFMEYEPGEQCHYLRVITANLNNGSFSVLKNDTVKNISSKVADIRNSSYGYMVHELGSDVFIFCSDVTNSLFNTFSIGAVYPTVDGTSYDVGFMKFSPFGNLLAVSSPLENDLRIYDFDPYNIDLNNERIIGGYPFNAIEFAVQTNILYAATDYDIYQINFSYINPVITHIGTTSFTIENLQLANDGKIYVAKEGDSFLGAIENPEIYGIGCYYNDYAISLMSPSNGTLPSVHPDIFTNSINFTTFPDTIYTFEPAEFYYNIPYDIDSCRWIFDDGFDSVTVGGSMIDLNRTFFQSGTYELTSLFYSATGTLLTKRHIVVKDRDFLSLHDTIICDTNNYFTLSADLPVGSTDFCVWYLPNGKIDSSNITTLTINQPGEYILKVYDQDRINLKGIDTAVVYTFYPSLTIDDFNDSIFYENEYIYLDAYLLQNPWDTIDSMEINYTWEIDDNIVLDGNFNYLDTVFDIAGSYPVDVSIFADVCAYSVRDTIEILPEVVIDTGFLSLHDTTVCDTPFNIVMSIPYPPDNYDIEWYFNDETMPFAYSDTVETYFPGKYSVFVYSIGTDQLIGKDTAFIHYKYCDDISMRINVDNDGYTCDSNHVFNFSAEIDPQYNACDDISSFYYVWYFGNGNSEAGYDLTNVSQIYSQSGIYRITLFVYDSRNCEHVYSKNIFVNQASSDTAFINLSENLENITINFDDFPVFETPYLDNNQFISSRTKNIFVNNPVIDSIYVSNSQTSDIQQDTDITLFVTGSFKGNININLIAPDGTIVNALSAVSDTIMFLFGRQAIIYENIPRSVPQTYIFSSSGKDFYDFDENYFANTYYSPDEYNFTDEYYYYVPSEIYRFNDNQSLVGTPINGTWQLEVSIDDFFGRLNTWGLIFNKNYFQQTIRPDSVSCTDQFGNEYQMHNNSLQIQNSAVSRYDLDCRAHYPQAECVVQKHLVVTVPSIPNVFTPNNDGINDTWISASPDINAHVIIIDKIGRIVADYYTQDKPEGWDGTYNGKPLPSDSYWYIITLENGAPVKGVVSIVR